MLRTAVETTETPLRTRILVATRELFLEGGLKATSVEAIVKRVRISKREFYGLFANRHDAFIAMAENFTADRGEFSLAGATPEEVIADAMLRIQQGQMAPAGARMFRAALAVRRAEPLLARRVYDARARTARALTDYIASLCGSPHDEAILTMLRMGFMATGGLVYLAGTALPDAPERAERAARLASLFLKGCAAAPLRQAPAAPLALGSPAPPPDRRYPPARLPMDAWRRVLHHTGMEIRDKGFDQASVERIALLAKVPKPTIYRRYGSKALLIEDALKSEIKAFASRLADFAPPADDVDAQLIAIAEDLSEKFCAKAVVDLQALLLAEADGDAALTARVYGYFRGCIVDVYAPLFDQLISDGLVADADASELAWHFFVQASFGSRFLFWPPETVADLRRNAEDAVDLILFGAARASRRSAHS